MSKSSDFLKRLDSFERRILLTAWVLLGLILLGVTFERLIWPRINPTVEQLGRTSNGKYTVKWNSYNFGVLGPWGTEFYLEGPWFLPYSDKEILRVVQQFGPYNVTLFSSNLLLLQADHNKIFATDVSHFNRNTFVIDSHFPKDKIDYSNSSISNGFVSINETKMNGVDNVIVLVVRFLQIESGSSEGRIYLYNTDSVNIRFYDERILEFDCKWGDGEWGKDYLIYLEHFLTEDRLALLNYK